MDESFQKNTSVKEEKSSSNKEEKSSSDDDEYIEDEYIGNEYEDGNYSCSENEYLDNCFNDSEYLIENNNDTSSEEGLDLDKKKEIDSETESEEEMFNKENKEKQIKKKLNIEEHLNNENESILILSSQKEIKDNKIIHSKKIMINVFTSSFTTNENLIINSIFNYNSDLLLQRNKTLNEYILVMIILNCFNIEIINNTIKMFPEIPWNKNSKKYRNNFSEIINLYDFKSFIKGNKCKKKNLKKPKNLIRCIINGFVFYIKNITLLEKQIFKDKEEKLEEFKNIILKDENSIFCEDENLKIISNWLTNLVKRILLFNFSIFILNKKTNLSYKKNIEEEVYIILNIIFYLIIILNNEKKLNKNKMDADKLKTFLIFNYRDTCIKNIIENDIFKIIIEYIYKNKNKKIFLCKKKYLQSLKENFI